MRNTALSPIAGLILAGIASVAEADPRTAQPVLIELFTSQGCSSCPPADAALATLAEREGVIALSLHVDYWDYLGWRDTFAAAEHTRRQYAYRDAFEARVVYTPQVVVQGRSDAVGMRLDEIERLIETARTQAEGTRIGFDNGAAALRVSIEGRGGGEIYAALYDRARTVAIERGENRGKTLTYRNVVRNLMRVGFKEAGAPAALDLPNPEAGQGMAVWLQMAGSGPVLAAGRYER
ncbi:MAG: DUF1223 domain-containing protein [Pseudomonadota bacterium]